VISHAGPNTIFEAIAFKKPVMVFPDKKQYEQEEIGKRVEELGIGRSIGYERLKWMKKEIEDLTYDEKELERLSKEINKNRGAEKIAEVIEGT